MQHLSATAITAVLSLIFLLSPTLTSAHNITAILNKYPEFSTFNHYLTETHLAAEINRRITITVCAVDNAGMADLLAKHLSISAMKNVLSLHVLLDYFGAKKLHQITDGTALAATMFQATGTATGTSGFVNITDLKGGKVGFGAEDNGGVLPASFVKSIDERPYNLSVIQISQILNSPEAEAPAPAPSSQNITKLMSAHGCKVFADALSASDAQKTYEDNLDGGLTIFCPLDDAFKKFAPKFKNLTIAGKQALLESHAMPVYESMQMLKQNNGLMNTLATDGASKFDITVQNDGEQVTLKTKLVTARITGTLFDEQPLSIYTINNVLLPKELFKGALSPTPAPAPEPAADSPKGSKKKKKKVADAPSDSPADSPDEDPSDQTADENGAVVFNGGGLVAIVMSVWLVLLQL
ncbi:fasciclin-like arabinogalactan protein 1 [Apium graveolens]|uniref:fasciclin-like arabinogalactan protein 1 n=1 Tax=Apium graveolens TaxID=4045 RepID=UPI003D78D929